MSQTDGRSKIDVVVFVTRLGHDQKISLANHINQRQYESTVMEPRITARHLHLLLAVEGRHLAS